jgi:hypothetical protein
MGGMGGMPGMPGMGGAGGAAGGPDMMSFFNNPSLMNMVCSIRRVASRKSMASVF